MASQGLLSGQNGPTPESYMLMQMLQAMGGGTAGRSGQPMQNAAPSLPNRQAAGTSIPYMPAFPGANPIPQQLAQLLGSGAQGSGGSGGSASGLLGGGKGGNSSGGSSQGLLSGLFSGKGGGINASTPYNAIDSSAAGVFNMGAGDAAASGSGYLDQVLGSALGAF